jgi:hypothetical protein
MWATYLSYRWHRATTCTTTTRRENDRTYTCTQSQTRLVLSGRNWSYCPCWSKHEQKFQYSQPSPVKYKNCKIGIVGVESYWVHSALRPLIGLLCQPRVIVIFEKLVEWWLAGETEVLGENLPQCYFVHHNPHMLPGRELGSPGWEARDWPLELRHGRPLQQEVFVTASPLVTSGSRSF